MTALFHVPSCGRESALTAIAKVKHGGLGDAAVATAKPVCDTENGKRSGTEMRSTMVMADCS